jgi:hypothetical protein
MRVFLCWSGTRGLGAADALKEFFEDLNEKLRPQKESRLEVFYSPDIDKGRLWFQAVQHELSKANAAVIVMTPENARSPWMHFEAGVVVSQILARSETASPIFTYLFGMEPSDLAGPLSSYQSTVATYADTRSMVEQLFKPADVAIANMGDAYDQAWTTLAQKLSAAQWQPIDQVLPGLEDRFARKTFDEPVAECHRQTWSDRISGCHETLHELRQELANVKQRCRPYQIELLQQVIRQLDLYEMTMQAYLIEEKLFTLRPDGTLNIPEEIREVCERRRREVKDAVAGLLDAARAPVFDQSPVFERLETFAEKKNLIHRQAASIRRWIKEQTGTGDGWYVRARSADWRVPPVLPPRESFGRAISSDWCCDRIFYYITHAECVRADLPLPDPGRYGIVGTKEISAQIAYWIEEELQRIRASARAGGATRMPLNYALALVLALMEWKCPKDPALRPFGLLEDTAVDPLKACLEAAIDIEKDKERSEVRSKAELLKAKISAAEASLLPASTAVTTSTSGLQS